MIARITSSGQHAYYGNVTEISTYDNVTEVSTEGSRGSEYLNLRLAAYPHLVHFWRGSGRVSVLLAATAEDFTAALRDEAAQRVQERNA